MGSDSVGGRPGDDWRARPEDVARAEEQVDRLTGRVPAVPEDVDRLVDRVLAGHGVVVATLERDLARHLRDELDARRSGDLAANMGESRAGNGVARLHAVREVTRRSRSAFRTLAEDLAEVPDLHPSILRDRQRRAELVAGLQPTEFRPRTRPPVVTRGGVFYVAPRFEQVRGIGEISDARLIRAGFVTAEAFRDAPDEELAALTGHAVAVIRAGKQDLDLTRLPGVDRKAADLLRLVNVHSISRLAARDPEHLAAELARVRERHRIWGFPSALATTEAVTRLVKKAEALAPA